MRARRFQTKSLLQAETAQFRRFGDLARLVQ